MKNSTRLMILMIAGLFLFSTAVYAGNDNAPRTGFVDLNGDGLNDNAKDDDADGIPNNLDGDFVKSEDGSSNMNSEQSKEQFQEQSEEHARLLLCWRTHTWSKELFQNQYGELGGGSSQSGQVTENTVKGSENATHNGGK